MFIKDFNKTAIIYGDDVISYARLIEMIRRYGSIFAAAKGERVAIFSENRPEWIYAFFSSWSKGSTNVLIDMFATKEEVSYILGDCAPSVIFTSDKNIETMKQAMKDSSSKATLINFDEVGEPPFPASENNYDFSDDDIALLLYTSGTTGASKGVMLSWLSLRSNIYWNNSNKRININDRLLAVLPAHHSWPLMATVLCPLECGATVVFLKNLNAEELVSTFKKQKITMLTAVPRLFEMLHRGIMAKIKANIAARVLFKITRTLKIMPLSKIIFGKVNREFGGCIKVLIAGGAKLDNEIIKDYRALGILMLEGYGLTETAPMATYHPFDAQRIGSVGKVFDEEDIKFGDDGEIILKGPNVMKGYWNKPEETAKVLVDGWLYTGDLGYMDKDRYLYITGRKKDIIVLPNGKNIRPDLIEEEILRTFPIVKEIAVTDKDGQLYAIIKPDFDRAKIDQVTNLSETIKWGVIDLYNQKAKSYNRIYDFMITSGDLPRTRMGKLRRYMLSSFIVKSKREKIKIEKPSYEEYSEVEQYIVYLTDHEPLPGDHFEIDLGMDSLSLVELQVFAEKTFGVTLGSGWTSQYSTVEALAEHIRDTKTKHELQSFDWGKILSSTPGRAAKPDNRMMNFLLLIFRVLFGRRVRVKTIGADKIPDGPCIIAPNHQSFMDSIVLLCGLPSNTRRNIFFLAKEKNFRSGIMRFFARRSNTVIMDINHDLVGSIRQIVDLLRAGHRVVIFPEGARSRGGSLGSFKKTFAIIAAEIGTPVVPVVIKGAYDVLPINAKYPRKGDITVEYLDKIIPGKMSVNDIVAETRRRIAEKL